MREQMIIRLRSSDDLPLANMPMTIRSAAGAPDQRIYTLTDANGVGRLDTRPPDTFSVEVQLPDGGVKTSRVITRPSSFTAQVLTITFAI